MNYSELSDFEINKLVAERAGSAGLFSYIIEVNEKNQVVYLCEKDGVFSIIPISHYDPCNNPSDAWPIILAGKIAIEPMLDGAWQAGHVEGYTDDEDSIYGAWWTDESPLRAAMIVFLMMEDK